MVNKNRLLMIVAIVLTASPGMAMEKIETEFSKDSTSLIIQQICLHENENNSNELQNQPHEEMISSEEAVIKILSLNRRRKSSESPRMRIFVSPRSTSPIKARAYIDNQRKANEGLSTESISISPDEQKEPAEYLSKASPEREKKPVQPGCRRYFLVGPIEFLQSSFPNPPQGEQKTSSEDEGVILPLLESKDQT